MDRGKTEFSYTAAFFGERMRRRGRVTSVTQKDVVAAERTGTVRSAKALIAANLILKVVCILNRAQAVIGGSRVAA